MPRIHILPEEIISKIAAGEVIERPASVLKELVENSLDAKATSIEVTLKDAGKTFMQVRDNGCGIEREDLPSVFYRHATSKITSLDDLMAIHSLGFRGEALYSIAAVSDCLLQSKTSEQKEGFEISVLGGKQTPPKPCAFSEHGTEIQIKELFFNTPARKKFLRSNTAEIQQVLNIFIPYTLLHKDVHFKLNHQGKSLLDIRPCENIQERFADVLNVESKHLITNTQAFPKESLTIKMVLGDINIKRSRRDMQFTFINNRPIFNKNISYHMNQIYRLIMAPEEFPLFAVYINMPAEDIDVNIHPTKREVKLRNETAICSIIRSMCEQTLMEKSSGKTINAGARSMGHGTSWALQRANSREDSAESTIPSNLFEEKLNDQTPYAYPRSQTRLPGVGSVGVSDFYIPQDTPFLQDNNLHKKLSSARFIGSFINKYLLFEAENSILLIDQHAAQERIFYEQFIQQLERGNLEIQHLLTPVLVPLSVSDRLIFEEVGKDFETIGVSCSLFDEETLAVHSHPQIMKNVEAAVRGILSGEKITKFDHDTIARRACRSSIMTGDKLSKEQAEYQRNQLIKCLDPFTCPHGRPIVVELTENFLDKQFLRI